MTRRSADELMRELRTTLSELVALDSAELSDLEVVESVRSAYQADSMLASFTTAITGEADRRRMHRREGASSCSAWVGALVRRPVGECREVVRRARRLGHMSLTPVALARGQVAPAHVRHLIRAQSTNLAAFARDEELLVEAARRRTFAIISHPDAGKTTLTEKFLLYAGARRRPAR
jgi:hypothetical protein